MKKAIVLIIAMLITSVLAVSTISEANGKNSQRCDNLNYPVSCNFDTWPAWQKYIYFVQQGIQYGNVFCGGMCEDEWGTKIFGTEFMEMLGDVVDYFSGEMCGEMMSSEDTGVVAMGTRGSYSSMMHCEGTKTPIINYTDPTQPAMYQYFVSYEIDAGTCDLNGTVSLFRADKVENSSKWLGKSGTTAFQNLTAENFTKVCINLRKITPDDSCLTDPGFQPLGINPTVIREFCNDLVNPLEEK